MIADSVTDDEDSPTVDLLEEDLNDSPADRSDEGGEEGRDDGSNKEESSSSESEDDGANKPRPRIYVKQRKHQTKPRKGEKYKKTGRSHFFQESYCLVSNHLSKANKRHSMNKSQ